MRTDVVDKGIILAAGDGNRLGYLTRTCPKVLLPVNNRGPIIGYPIEALLAAGISEIAIVVGYLGDRIMEVLGDGSKFGVKLEYIFNPDYLTGAGVSLHKAKDWARGEPVVLCMGDHLIEEKLVKGLLDSQTSNEVLCVDYSPLTYYQLAEATKVTLDDERCITDIGKALVGWDAVDMGVFLLTERFFQALEELVHGRGSDTEISDVVRFLISQGHRFHTYDASGCFWADVDTEEDLNMARMGR